DRLRPPRPAPVSKTGPAPATQNEYPRAPMNLPLTPIHVVQGDTLQSPLASQTVRVRGVVTGHSRRGYFVQDPDGSPDPLRSDAIFVYSPRRRARVGAL